ncbi:NADH-quinone oxidoreductase subunit K [Microvirga sp. 2YAF29]|uniref:NADH-quinone oxidoreductase subunit K n=1 Tax=Microvirga sp. 2YAF29 TaxID=3233031 RepID=UPI003F9E0BC1
MIADLSPGVLFGICGAALVGIGLFAVITHPGLLRRIVGFNILGAGIFLVFGAIARRGAGSGFESDPVPQALVITGIVVAFSATALAVALLRRLFELTSIEMIETAPGQESEP